MAEEASVESAMSQHYCHKCNVIINDVQDFKCPRCRQGFVEILDAPENNEENDSDLETVQLMDLLNYVLMVSLNGSPLEDSVGPRRTGRTGRNRTENFIQEFIVNLAGGGGGGGGWGGQLRNTGGGNVSSGPVLFLGNPGDYAWGRDGLDAIVTQLLNQMDGTGPPPLAKDKIQEIPVVIITQDQVDSCLQCSVCWEDFKVNEPVRKLSCEHVYHDPCIIPWLELHGTCPICRKTLNEGDGNDENASSSVNSVFSPIFRNFGNTFVGGNHLFNSHSLSPSSNSSTSNSSSSTTSSSSTSRNQDFMDFESND